MLTVTAKNSVWRATKPGSALLTVTEHGAFVSLVGWATVIVVGACLVWVAVAVVIAFALGHATKAD